MFEAIEVARKTGKPVLCVNAGLEAMWYYGELVWRNGTEIALTPKHLDSEWEVVEPKPKEYDFAEAYQMMKAGKWMKPVDATLEHACIKDEWRCRNSKSYYASCSAYLCWKHVEAKWIEVQS